MTMSKNIHIKELDGRLRRLFHDALIESEVEDLLEAFAKDEDAIVPPEIAVDFVPPKPAVIAFRVRIGPVAMAANDVSVDLAVTGGSVKMHLDSADGTTSLCQLKFSRQGSKLKVQLLPSSTADASIFDLTSSIAVAHLSKDHPVYVGDFGSLEVTQQLLYERFKPVRRESNE